MARQALDGPSGDGPELTIGAASFMLPRMAFDPWTEGVALIVAMSAITLFVALAVRDVILVMVDVAAVFEGVARRLDQLVMPMMAFVTFYSLLVVVFGCLYRIADLTTRRAADPRDGTGRWDPPRGPAGVGADGFAVTGRCRRNRGVG